MAQLRLAIRGAVVYTIGMKDVRTILVTGGVGFIGSNFVRYLLQNYPDMRVVAVDCLTYAAHLESVRDALGCSRFVLERVDITDAVAIERVFADYAPQVVVNFAAESHVDRSIEHPDLFVKTNVSGTGVLLSAACRHGVRRYHQISTDEVYGDLPLDSDDRFGETSPLRPSSPYAASKAAADLLTLSYHRTYGLPVSITRASNNYGPCQYPEKLIPLCILHALAGEPIPVYGDGRNVRDWLWVEDHCRAVDLVLQKGTAGEVYNVGGDSERDNLAVVRSVLRALGRTDDLIRHVADRKGHDRRYGLDSGKLHALGWRPTVGFDQGLANTVRWYLQNRQWWQSLPADR